ncbi:aminotransferase family protein [Aspergillus floccosus]
MTITYGKNMRSHFLFEPGWTNMNHGSFGAIPSVIRDSLHKKQQLVEAAPDTFVRYTYGKNLIESRRAVAKLVDAPLESVVFVPNATTGVDTILRNLEYTSSDHILMFDTVYGACERTAFHLSETTQVHVTCISLTHPVSHSQIISRFLEAVNEIHRKGHRVKVALFDVISFQPAVRMPFERLVELCDQLDILSCVDGAHCIGQIPISLNHLDCDFFVGNLHKWLFVPRGCAVLYAPARNQALLRTTFPTSWGFAPNRYFCRSHFKQTAVRQTPFENLFESFGTMDYSPFLCAADALEFRQSVGGEAEIMRYNAELAQRGGRLLAQILNTEILDDVDRDLTRGCSMVNVRLPIDASELGNSLMDTLDYVQRSLIEGFKTYVPVFEHGGNIWARASAQIYLTEDDFAYLGRSLKAICDELQKGRGAHGNECPSLTTED